MAKSKKIISAVTALAITASAIGVVNFQAAAAETKFEFEDGSYSSDCTLKSGADYSGGSAVRMEDSGTVSVDVEVEETGMYKLILCASGIGGGKIQNLSINGVSQGQASISEGLSEESIGLYTLNAGSNTITFTKSWGWTDFDYIIAEKTETTVASVSPVLSDKNATAETQSLMNYLSSVYGNHIISGQQEIYMYGPHDFEYEFEWLYDLTGAYPAIRGFDYLNAANPLYGSEDGTNDRIIDWVKNKNGIATASWHICVPNDITNYNVGDYVSYENSTYKAGSEYTNFKTSNVLVEGTTEKAYFDEAIRLLAEQLSELQDEGVPLIFRPLHEAEGSGGEDGSWFWWGEDGSEVYKQIWVYLYEQITEVYGIHNIIWEWNSYTYSTSADWYPGDEYVDIIGYDKYNADGSPNESAIEGTFYSLNEMYNGNKMIAMAENDTIPSVENLISTNAGWLYFCPWYGDHILSESYNDPDTVKSIYQSEYVLTLDEMPADLYTNSEAPVTTTSDPNAPIETTTTTSKPEQIKVEYDVADLEIVEDAEFLEYVIPIDRTQGTPVSVIINATVSCSGSGYEWACSGGGIASETIISEDTGEETWGYKSYQFNVGTSNVTVKLTGLFNASDEETFAGELSGDSVLLQHWWGSSSTSQNGEDVSTIYNTITVVYEASEEVTTTNTETPDETTVTTLEETTEDTGTGSETDTSDPDITTTTASESSTEVEEGLKGDVNGDGKISSIDIVMMKQYMLEQIDISEINSANADINGDGSIKAIDLVQLKQLFLQ